LKPSVKEGNEGILVIVPTHQLSLLVLLFLIRMLLFAVADEKQEDEGEGRKGTYAI
jgi:hypothetical protein